MGISKKQKRLVSPAQKHCSSGISGPHGTQENKVAFAKPLLSERIHKAERNRCSGGVAEVVDVRQDLGIVHTQSLLHGANDPQVRLVWHNESKVAARKAVAFQNLDGEFAHAAYGIFKNLC